MIPTSREVRRWAVDCITSAALALVHFVNTERSNALAFKLRVLANEYDTRPRETP